MKLLRSAKLAWMAGLFFGGLVAVCTGMLIVDYLQALYRAPIEKGYIESMEEAVKTDAGVSVELTEEREAN